MVCSMLLWCIAATTITTPVYKSWFMVYFIRIVPFLWAMIMILIWVIWLMAVRFSSMYKNTLTQEQPTFSKEILSLCILAQVWIF